MKEFVSWEEFDNLITDLYNKIISSSLKFTALVPISRGGFVPAICLSHRLGIQNIVPVIKRQPLDAQFLRGTIPLIVDDIHDTGETLQPVSEFFSRLFGDSYGIAVLHNRYYVGFQKKQPTTKCFFYAKHIPHKNWIVYPWEVE